MLYDLRMSVLSPLDEDPADTPVSVAAESPSPKRLRALRALALKSMESGDEEKTAELTEKFRSEYAVFAADKTPSQADQALNVPTEQ